MFDDPATLTALLLALPPATTVTVSTGPSASSATAPLDAPPLPVYAVFASSGRGALVPSASGSAPAVPQARPLDAIVTPLAANQLPPALLASVNHKKTALDPRCRRRLGGAHALGGLGVLLCELAWMSSSRCASAHC